MFTVTAKQNSRVLQAVHQLALDPKTVWVQAEGAEAKKGSEVGEADLTFAGRELRLIVRRQPVAAGEQLALDDLDGWRFHAIITNIPGWLASAVAGEHHHRLRGGGPEEAIRQLKGDFGLNHAPVRNFFGNWREWRAAALAYNLALAPGLGAVRAVPELPGQAPAAQLSRRRLLGADLAEESGAR